MESQVLCLGLEGRLGHQKRERAKLTLQNKDWTSLEFFIDVFVLPHHITVWVKNYPRPTKENRSV